jgi:DNA polymerase III subunit epsilon
MTQPYSFLAPTHQKTDVAKPKPSASNDAPTVPPADLVNDDTFHEARVRELEATGCYRVLRKLRPRPIVRRKLAPKEKVAIILDTETTGLDGARDEIIELGMIAFTYDEDCRIGDVVATFSALREPSIPITPTITKLTGITPEMAAGRVLDVDAVAHFIERAAIVIAHNARFDRPFCDRLAVGFSEKAWACSATEVPWSNLGFEGTKLGYLVSQLGRFYEKHRAINDCHALLEVLAAALPGGDGTGFSHLLGSARTTRYRIWAINSPFDRKDTLKARGYRWNDGGNGRPKSWWIECSHDGQGIEREFLRSEVYLGDVDPFIQRLTAFDRYKATT